MLDRRRRPSRFRKDLRRRRTSSQAVHISSLPTGLAARLRVPSFLLQARRGEQQCSTRGERPRGRAVYSWLTASLPPLPKHPSPRIPFSFHPFSAPVLANMFFSKPILAQALAALLLSTPTFAAVVKSDIDASPSQRTDQGLCDMLASAGLINLDRHGCEHSTSDIDADPEFKASVCSALYHGGLTGLDSIGCGVEHIHHGLLLERKDDRNGKGTSGHGPHIRARNLKHHGHHRKHPYHHHGGGGSTGGGSSNPAPPPPQPQPQPPTLPPPQCSLTKFCSVTQNSLIWNSANNVCNSYYAPPGAPAPPPAPAPAPAPQPSAAGLFPPFEGYGGSASAFQARQAAAAATPCNNTDICKIMQTGLFNTATLGCNYSGVGA